MAIAFSEKFIGVLERAENVVILTGAGVSAESGVPTFRGQDGLWKKFRPEELATFEAFEKNPELVWEWYRYRRNIISEIKPNDGHFAMAEMEHLFDMFHLLTQNVDGLHEKAGSKNMIELHGNIRRNKCLNCRQIDFRDDFDKYPPLCQCGGKLRPDVVWFGELLPEAALRTAFEVSQDCDLFFVAGTSAAVYPAASLPALARKHGAFVIEINIEPTDLTYIVDEHIEGKSGEIFPEIVKKLKKLKGII